MSKSHIADTLALLASNHSVYDIAEVAIAQSPEHLAMQAQLAELKSERKTCGWKIVLKDGTFIGEVKHTLPSPFRWVNAEGRGTTYRIDNKVFEFGPGAEYAVIVIVEPTEEDSRWTS
jgi:hypothetical protein